MESVAFDTHSFVKRLTKAGMPEPQAEVLAEEQSRLLEYKLASKKDIEEVKRDIEQLRLATKKDIEEVKRDIEELRLASKKDIEELKAETKRDIAELRAETRRDIKELENTLKKDIAESKIDILKWMFGTLLGQTAVLAALIKLF